MKLALKVFLFAFTVCSCSNTDESKRLENYLSEFNRNINEFKVISFVPANGCNSCVMPTLEFSRGENDNYLLVISSISKKTINHVIQIYKLNESKIVKDTLDLAAKAGFVPLTAPSYFFLKNGHIEKVLDLSNESDKLSSLTEVKDYLKGF